MTPDEQEALSFRYCGRCIIHLTSGNYAVFDVARKLIYVGPDPLSLDLHAEITKPLIPQKRKLDLSKLNLRKPTP